MHVGACPFGRAPAHVCVCVRANACVRVCVLARACGRTHACMQKTKPPRQFGISSTHRHRDERAYGGTADVLVKHRLLRHPSRHAHAGLVQIRRVFLRRNDRIKGYTRQILKSFRSSIRWSSSLQRH